MVDRKNYHGDLYNINVKYHSETIRCTDEHPFYTREKVRKWNNKFFNYFKSRAEKRKIKPNSMIPIIDFLVRKNLKVFSENALKQIKKFLM